MLVVASPIKNREWILPKFIECLKRLDVSYDDVIYLFLDDASDDNSLGLLQEFALHDARVMILKNTIPFAKNTSSRDIRNRKELYHHLSALRNRLIDTAIGFGADRVFMVDSDILVVPQIVSTLENHDVDYCATVVSNTKTIKPADLKEKEWYDSCNILVENKGGALTHMQPVLLNKLITCNVSGAAFLVKGHALKSGAKFEYHLHGEDVGYCYQLAEHDIQIHVDTTIMAVHAFTRTSFQQACNTYEALYHSLST